MGAGAGRDWSGNRGMRPRRWAVTAGRQPWDWLGAEGSQCRAGLLERHLAGTVSTTAPSHTWAATVWDLVGKSFVTQAVLKPASERAERGPQACPLHRPATHVHQTHGPRLGTAQRSGKEMSLVNHWFN